MFLNGTGNQKQNILCGLRGKNMSKFIIKKKKEEKLNERNNKNDGTKGHIFGAQRRKFCSSIFHHMNVCVAAGALDIYIRVWMCMWIKDIKFSFFLFFSKHNGVNSISLSLPCALLFIATEKKKKERNPSENLRWIYARDIYMDGCHF